MLQPFVTEDQLKTIASLSSSIETQFLTPYLMVSQDMSTVPLIGIALAQELSNQLLSGTTTPENQSLLEGFILPFQAYKAWELAVPFLGIKAYKKSLVRPVDPGSESLSVEDMKYYRANITTMVNFYKQRLFDFLEADAQLPQPVYPLYRSVNTKEFRTDGNSATGFYFKTKVCR